MAEVSVEASPVSLNGNGHAKQQPATANGKKQGLPDWEVELSAREDVEYAPSVLDYIIRQSQAADLWKWDHVTLKEALVGRGMMEDVRFYMRPGRQSLYAVWTLGSEMVGHPKIVHGGAISFGFDESFGVLYASLNMGPGFTAHLGVDFRKPFPAGQPGCIEARVDRVEGRKVFLKAALKDGPDGVLYAEADALFLGPKISPPTTQ